MIFLLFLYLFMVSSPVNGLSFAVIGDWGRGGAHHQTQVGRTLRAQNISFVVSVGDNFYPRGISSTHDPNQLQWEEIYAPRIPWYLALGNHDYRGNIDAQVALSHIYSYWNMPATYYDVMLGSNHFFFIDTTPWVSGADVSTQEQWLTRSYSSSNALRKYIVGHHPLWTWGYHHDRDDVTSLRKVLVPLFQKFGGVYLTGHDHNLQHIVQDGVQQFISGAGAYTYQVQPCDGMVYGNGEDAGFLLVEDTKYTFVNRYGEALYTASL